MHRCQTLGVWWVWVVVAWASGYRTLGGGWCVVRGGRVAGVAGAWVGGGLVGGWCVPKWNGRWVGGWVPGMRIGTRRWMGA